MSQVIAVPDSAPGQFDRIARFYEFLASAHSTGQIAAAKASQVARMSRTDRVLYVGVGGGEDAVAAARRGAQVTCIDLSAKMLARTQAKLDKEHLRAELIHGDILEHRRSYDVVTANFFLNCFTKDVMPRFLQHVASLVDVGGRLMIADIAVPQGNLLARTFHRSHNAIGIGFFWLLGLVSLHGIYDYQQYFAANGLVTEDVERFRLFRVGPVSYESICALKQAA